MILTRLGIKTTGLQSGESGNKYFSESFTYTINNNILCEAGKISEEYLDKFDIGQDVLYAHIDWDLLMKTIKGHSILFSELPKYPWVRRDLALLIDRNIKFSLIRDIAFRTEKRLLKEVDLFDVYESDTLGKNKKSYAVSFILRDDEKTLTDTNIDKIMENLKSAFEKEINAHIR